MTTPTTLDYAPPAEFDAGRFVARYLRVVAWTSIVWMIAHPIFFDAFHLDLAPIFMFWAASALKRRSRTARKWVLSLAGLALAMIVLSLGSALIVGTNHLAVSLHGKEIQNPALWQVAAVALLLSVLIGIPFAVLKSAAARRQFAKGPFSEYSNRDAADRLSKMQPRDAPTHTPAIARVNDSRDRGR